MTKQKPEYIDKYIAGINPALRLRHRGILRSLQYHELLGLDDLSEYMQAVKAVYPDGFLTAPTYGKPEPDGYCYFYADEFFCLAESMQHAASILNRNRSTLNDYRKKSGFPCVKNINGDDAIDIIATQDFILMRTNHHTELAPYWPDIKNNSLIVMHSNQIGTKEPLFELHEAEAQDAKVILRAARR